MFKFWMTSVAILDILVSLESLLESCKESRFCLILSKACREETIDNISNGPCILLSFFINQNELKLRDSKSSTECNTTPINIHVGDK